jgi:hypothetical protein
MTVSNEHFAIPPGHPLAKEFYDLQCIQATLMKHMIPGCPLYDDAKQDEYSKALGLTGEAIRFLQGQYRHERGADDSCTVSLTYGANFFPQVEGRPSDGSPFIHPGPLKRPVLN